MRFVVHCGRNSEWKARRDSRIGGESSGRNSIMGMRAGSITVCDVVLEVWTI